MDRRAGRSLGSPQERTEKRRSRRRHTQARGLETSRGQIGTNEGERSTNVESEKRNERRAINDVTEPNGAERRQPGRRGRADGPRKR